MRVTRESWLGRLLAGVSVDGVRVEHAFEVDTREGWVRHWHRDDQGKPVLVVCADGRRRFATRYRHGRVELHWYGLGHGLRLLWRAIAARAAVCR